MARAPARSAQPPRPLPIAAQCAPAEASNRAEMPRTSRSTAITPRDEDAVTRRNSYGIVRDILKGRTLARHNDIGEQYIIGVQVGATLDRRNHRYADVGDVFQSLNTLVVNLAPDFGIRDVTER